MSDATKEAVTEKLSGGTSVHYVLLIVENRLLSNEQRQAWSGFPEAVQNIMRKGGVADILGDNCWTFHLDKNLPSFVNIAHEAEVRGLTYRVLFFSERPQWIESIHPWHLPSDKLT